MVVNNIISLATAKSVTQLPSIRRRYTLRIWYCEATFETPVRCRSGVSLYKACRDFANEVVPQVLQREATLPISVKVEVLYREQLTGRVRATVYPPAKA